MNIPFPPVPFGSSFSTNVGSQGFAEVKYPPLAIRIENKYKLNKKYNNHKKACLSEAGRVETATRQTISTDLTDRRCGFHCSLRSRGLSPTWTWSSPWTKT